VRSRAGLAVGVVATGLTAVVAVQAVAPISLPLFDGVVVNEPYRWLSPPPDGMGSPTSAAQTIQIAGGASPAFVVYTDETPPQAELLANGGEFVVGEGDESVKVTIDPISPAADQASAQIAGNIYRFAASDEAGTALPLLSGKTVTVAMRSPPGISAGATISRLAGGAWQALASQPSGLPDLYLANTNALGDFAVTGALKPTPSAQSPALLVAATVAAGLIVLLGLRLGRSEPRPTGATSGRRRPRR
jgi:hypothetical protein